MQPYETDGGFFVIKSRRFWLVYNFYHYTEDWIIMENNYLTYKGRPLVRCGNEKYYGSMSDKYIVFIREIATKKVNDVDVGSKFEIQLRFTDPDIKGKGKIVKSIERASFADSLELAEAWLNRHNTQK